jgi:hypothetical protein
VNQVRTKAELLELYNYYQKHKDEKIPADWIRYLKLSPNTFSKWQKGIAPKLPKKILPSKQLTEKNNLAYNLAFEEIAHKLNMDLNQVKECYSSAMIKIQQEIKSKRYRTLREALSECEAKTVDSLF